MSHASYHSDVFTHARYEEIIEAMARGIEALPNVPDAIAFRGMSGCSFGFPLAFITGISLLYIRKPAEVRNCHSGRLFEGPLHEVKTYVIVDDLVSSGNTVRDIVAAVRAGYGRSSPSVPPCVEPYVPRCVAILTAQSSGHGVSLSADPDDWVAVTWCR